MRVSLRLHDPHARLPLPPVPHRILGLDPGLQTTGYGVVEITPAGPRVAEAGVVRSAKGRAKLDLADRVKALYDGIQEVLDQWAPAALAVEQLFVHYAHPRTAILMGHARGVFLLAGAQRGIPVLSYTATQVKKLITGHGHAGKEQMQYTVMRELGLDAVPEPADVADALAVALCHHYAGRGIMNGSRGAVFRGVNRALFEPQPDADCPEGEAA